MIKFIDRNTGVEMWVADERVEEYKAAGYKLAADDSAEKPKKKPGKKKD